MKRLFAGLVLAFAASPGGMSAQDTELEQEAPAEAELSEFEKAIADAERLEGFFETYRKDGHLYWVVPEDRLGSAFLMSFQVSQGPGARGIFGGTSLDREAHVVSLEKRDGKILLVERVPNYVAPAGSAEAEALDLTFGSSVLATAPIAAARDSVDHLIDVHDWFVSDLSGIGEALKEVLSSQAGRSGSASFDRSRSYLDMVKNFPRNMTVNSRLTFRAGAASGLRGVADWRYVPITVHARIVALPETPMTRRKADDRVGYYVLAQKDLGSDEETGFFRRYVRRWRLECERPGPPGGLCDPRQQIVYYVDRSVPERYREAMMAGVEAWDAAFEEAGFRDAIRAELLPADADAEDIRYATLRWNVSDPSGYGAIGPAVLDPRTGEILDADILFESSLMQSFKTIWRYQVDPVDALNESFAIGSDQLEALTRGGEAASFGAALAVHGTVLRAQLVEEGRIDPGDPVPEPFVDEVMKWVTMHEIGHTLGLRHNFRASTDTPNERLGDRDWTEENGVSSSVMEYPSPNIVGPNADELFYNAGMGTYDLWAIAYGYTPDPDRAAALAREAALPGHAYGTDEDAYGPGSLDPTVNIWDLGQNPLGWARGQAERIRDTWSRVPDIALEDDGSYADATQVFNTLLFQYGRALSTGVKYVGGQYQYRDHVGDAGGRGPWRPVPVEEQRRALDFLTEFAFDRTAFELPSGLLQQFGADRWTHWGSQSGGRIDYPYHQTVLGMQRALITQVTHPWVLSRMRDGELKYGPDTVLGIPELMERLSDALWWEVANGEDVPAMRRDLQRAYLDRLILLVTEAPDGTPADARSVARLMLERLRAGIEAALANRELDAYTVAHLGESKARIEAALAAAVQLANE